MSVFGVAMVRDEDDIIGFTLPRMAAQLDHVIVADNMSGDDTLEILHACAEALGNITIVADREPAYFQSRKMTHLAELARESGAQWVVPFDADEVWYTTNASLRTFLRGEVAASFAVCHAVLYDHVATGTDNRSVPDVPGRMVWRRAEPGALPKVAVRTLPGLVIEQGNHGAHYPGRVDTFSESPLVIHHYPYRSVEQMARKARNGAAAYDAAGDAIPIDIGRHWRDYGRFLEAGGVAAIREIFETWFYVAEPEGSGLVHDPCPVPMPW